MNVRILVPICAVFIMGWWGCGQSHDSAKRDDTENQNQEPLGSSDLEGEELAKAVQRGGQLYDHWAKVSGQSTPEVMADEEGDAISNPADAKHDFRCKNCHGWDYRGSQGFYRGKSYAVGLDLRAWAAGKTVAKIADKITHGEHGMPAYGDVMSAAQIMDLSYFLKEGLHDTNKLFAVESDNQDKRVDSN